MDNPNRPLGPLETAWRSNWEKAQDQKKAVHDRLYPTSPPKSDPVDHPAYYNSHPSGVECIQIVEWMNFCLGNAVKYIWRAGEKDNDAIEDLKKARWYLDREIARREDTLKRLNLEYVPPESRREHLLPPSPSDHQCKLNLNLCRGACACVCPNCLEGKRLWAEAGYPISGDFVPQNTPRQPVWHACVNRGVNHPANGCLCACPTCTDIKSLEERQAKKTEGLTANP